MDPELDDLSNFQPIQIVKDAKIRRHYQESIFWKET